MQEFKWMTFPFEFVKNAPYLQTNWCSHLLTYKVNSSFNYIYILCLLHNCQKILIKSNTLSDFKALQIYKITTFGNKVENFTISYFQDFFCSVWMGLCSDENSVSVGDGSELGAIYRVYLNGVIDQNGNKIDLTQFYYRIACRNIPKDRETSKTLTDAICLPAVGSAQFYARWKYKPLKLQKPIFFGLQSIFHNF